MKSDYKKIENALLAVDQAKFQDIVGHILHGECKDIKNFVKLGSAKGTNKTRSGVPDTFFQLSNGNFLFVEVTTQRDGLGGKIIADLNNCKEKAKKEDIPVERVIYACNQAKPAIEKILEYETLCKGFCKAENPFEIWGLDHLSTLLSTRYRHIASSELGIAFTFGSFQVLDEWFVNKLDVSQDHEFLHREDDIAIITESLMANKVVLLHGKPGCGKTRLAVQIASQFEEKRGFRAFITKGSNTKIMDDLHLENNGRDILIILDDVNRMPYLKEFINYSNKYKNVNVIATVRDYAFGDIMSDLKNYELEAYVTTKEIELLTWDKQEAIIRKIAPKANFEMLRLVREIAHENLRFGVMCAMILAEGKDAPKTIKDLMDEHFKAFDGDIKREENVDKATLKIYRKALLTVAILHRVVDVESRYTGQNSLDTILQKFNLSRFDFLDAMNYWDNKEYINISSKRLVFEIADQILANYLFYKFVFEQQVISLTDIFELMFPRQRGQIVSMFKALIPAYGYKNTVLEKAFKDLWENKYKNQADSDTKYFLEAFHTLLRDETIDYISNQIDKSNGVEFLPIICCYESSNKSIDAIDLILKIMESSQISDKDIESIAEAFSIKNNSFRFNLIAQIYLLEQLKERFDKPLHKKLFLACAKKLLSFSFSYTSFENEFEMTRYSLEVMSCDPIFELRKHIWEGLMELFQNDFERRGIFSILQNNRHNPFINRNDAVHLIIQKDAEVIKGLLKTFKTVCFEEKLFVKYLMECGFLDGESFYKSKITELQKEDKSFEIYSKINTRRVRGQDLDARKKRYEALIPTLDNHLHFVDFLDLLSRYDYCQGSNAWEITEALDLYFNFLDKGCSHDILIAFKEIFEKISNLNCIPANSIRIGLKNCKAKDLFLLLKNKKSTSQNTWLLNLFMQLEVKDIDDEIYDECYNIICGEFIFLNQTPRTRWSGEVITNLLNFEKYRKGFVASIFTEAVKQTKKGKKIYKDFFECLYYYEVGNLWSFRDLTMEVIEGFFGDNVKKLYYEVYFHLIGKGSTVAGKEFIKYLGKKDIKYVFRYYEILLETNCQFMSRSVLKEFPHVAKNLMTLVEIQFKNGIHWISYRLRNIIPKLLDDQESRVFIDLVISKFKNNTEALFEIASAINDMNDESCFYFVNKLIAMQIDLVTFQSIPILSHPRVWSGSEGSLNAHWIGRIERFLMQATRNTKTIKYMNILQERMGKIKNWSEQTRLQDLAESCRVS